MDREKIIARLKKIRLERGLTQKDVADIMGIAQTSLSRIEAGTHSPSVDLLERYADAVGCRIDIVSK